MLEIGLLKFSTDPSERLPCDVVDVMLDRLGAEVVGASYLICNPLLTGGSTALEVVDPEEIP